jgi:hypothetical protein
MSELFLYLSIVMNDINKDVIVKGVINPDWVRNGYLKDVTAITRPVCSNYSFTKPVSNVTSYIEIWNKECLLAHLML